jgi:hypothetical protein
VLSRDAAQFGGGWTAAHELFHAVQDRYASYAYDDLGGWFWEATAEWAASHVLPNDWEHGSFLGGYALLPHLSVSHFDYPDTGAFEEYHHYGAFIFPRFVDEVLADPSVIRATWENEPGSDDPLVTLARATAERGADLPDLFALFAVSLLDWSDYQHASLYADNVEQWASMLPDDDHRLAATEMGPTEGLVAAPEDTLPRRFGINAVRFPRTAPGSCALTAPKRATAAPRPSGRPTSSSPARRARPSCPSSSTAARPRSTSSLRTPTASPWWCRSWPWPAPWTSASPGPTPWSAQTRSNPPCRSGRTKTTRKSAPSSAARAAAVPVRWARWPCSSRVVADAATDQERRGGSRSSAARSSTTRPW